LYFTAEHAKDAESMGQTVGEKDRGLRSEIRVQKAKRAKSIEKSWIDKIDAYVKSPFYMDLGI
jgi:hypothetical protein